MSSLLEGIARALRGNPCQHVVKQTGNEITVSGASVGIANFKFDMGGLSNKIVEFYKVGENTVTLDQTQYLLCTSIFQMGLSDTVKDICNRTRLQIILSYNQLSGILISIQTNPTDELKKKLADWLDYTSQITQRSIESLNPPSPQPTLEPGASKVDTAFDFKRVTGYDTFSTSPPLQIPSPPQETYSEFLTRIAEQQGIEHDEMQKALKILS